MRKLLSDRGPEHQPIQWSMPKSDGRTGRRVIATVLAIGLLLAPLTIAVAALSGVGHRWVDILAQFTAPALVLTASFAVLLGLLRMKTAFVAAILVVTALSVAVWPQWAADRGKAQEGAPVLTLYSANLYFENDDVSAIKASITKAKPDIVVLVEASQSVMLDLDKVLSDYPYRRISSARQRGAVIASRYPLRTALHNVSGVSYAIAVVDGPLGPLNVVGVHLTRPWPYQVQWEQIRQASAVSKVTSLLSGPTIVAGDFNSISSSLIGRQIQAETGLKPNPGWPGTWPSQIPAFLGFTIDQVYRSPDLAVVSRRVGRRTGSDHRPVVTRFTLAEPRPAS